MDGRYRSGKRRGRLRNGENGKEALRQIEEKDYQANLRAKGIPEKRIRKYGFAFCGKRVLTGRKQYQLKIDNRRSEKCIITSTINHP